MAESLSPSTRLGDNELDDSESVTATVIPRGLAVLLTAAAAMIVVAGIRAFATTIGPAFLALVIVVVVNPVQVKLRAMGVPSWLAFTAYLVSAFGVLIVMGLAITWSAFEMIGLVTSDTYTVQLAEAQDQFITWINGYGVSGDDVEELASRLDIGAVAGQITAALSGMLGIVSALSVLLITMLFMILDAAKFEAALDAIMPDRSQVVDGLQGFARSTRMYFVVATLFGLIVAVLDTLVLVWLGIPLALVWGILSLITNYIPNIGFVLGLIPPAILAFLEGGWQLALWVIGAYLVINVIVQALIQPRIVGDAVGLSATLTFISLLFWNWVLGPLGALLAVPMSLLAKALLIDIDPDAQWIRPLVSLADRRDKSAEGHDGLVNADTFDSDETEIDDVSPEPAPPQ